jgi:RimJ/RimL family protein N-acetyltransferase
MSAFDVRIETPRLILRPPVEADFEPWAELSADEETMRTLGGVQVRPVAWRSFLFVVGGWQILGFSPFSVIEKSSGRWIGRVGPMYPEGWPAREVGWTIARPAWSKGYATEAATAAIDWAFARLGWDEVVHCIEDGNLASRRVAERLGAQPLRMARLPPPFDPMPALAAGNVERIARSF